MFLKRKRSNAVQRNICLFRKPKATLLHYILADLVCRLITLLVHTTVDTIWPFRFQIIIWRVAGYLRDTKRSGTEYSLLSFFHPISSTVRQADSVEDNGQPVALRWLSYKGQAKAISLQALCKILSRGSIFMCFLTHTAVLAQYCAHQASRRCQLCAPN